MEDTQVVEAEDVVTQLLRDAERPRLSTSGYMVGYRDALMDVLNALRSN